MTRSMFSFLRLCRRTSVALTFSALCLFLTSCQQKADDADSSPLVDVNVSLSGLNVDQTRATISETNVTNVTFEAIDANNAVQATVAQTSSDTDFGTLSLKLPVGDYTFVAIANSKNATATITSATEATINSAQNLTIYSATKSVSISGNTAQTVIMDMGKRKNTIFTLKITDTTPDDVAKLQIQVSATQTPATSITFNPSTGLASESKSYEFSLLKTTAAGSFQNKVISLYFPLTETERELDITINALSSEGYVLYTRTLHDVTFKQSESTTATGTFFSSATSGSFTFDTSIVNTDISLD